MYNRYKWLEVMLLITEITLKSSGVATADTFHIVSTANYIY